MVQGGSCLSSQPDSSPPEEVSRMVRIRSAYESVMTDDEHRQLHEQERADQQDLVWAHAIAVIAMSVFER